MSFRLPRRALTGLSVALGATAVLAVACSGAPPRAAPVVQLPRVERFAPPEPAASPDAVEVIHAGAEPRQALRYTLTNRGELTLHSELVVFQPMYRYQTRYAPVERAGDSFVVPLAMTMQASDSMLGQLLSGNSNIGPAPSSSPGPGPSFPPYPRLGALPACSTSVQIDARGFLTDEPRDHTCAKFEASLFGLHATPLRPTIPLPLAPIGSGARWRVPRASGSAAATYTLLHHSGTVLWVSAELEPILPAKTVRPHPREAWLLARVDLAQPLSAATLAWPARPRPTTAGQDVDGSNVDVSSTRTTLTRFNTVAGESAGALRAERLVLLGRALGSPDPALRLTAIRAIGISNEWRLISPLLELSGGDAATRDAIGQALTSLTGRSVRGPEDYIEASSPAACRGEDARAETVLSRGIELAGAAPVLQARLLAIRAGLRRKLGQHAAADRDFNEALARAPAEPEVVLAAAWWLATAPDSKLRSGRRALDGVRSLPNTQSMLMRVEQTQAAAHAELGNFAEAARVQQSAVSVLASRAKMGVGVEERASAAAARLTAYSRRQPWREGLTLHEWPSCYRYLGLSNTLL